MKVIELLEGVDVATTEAPEEILVFADGCLVGQATAAYPGPWGWVRGRKAGANNAVVVAVAADVRISRVPAGPARRNGRRERHCARCRSIVHARHRPDAPEARDELRRDAALRSVFVEEVPPKTRTEPDIFPAPTPHHLTAADVRITAQMSPLAQHLFDRTSQVLREQLNGMTYGAPNVPAGPLMLVRLSTPYPRPGTYGDKS